MQEFEGLSLYLGAVRVVTLLEYELLAVGQTPPDVVDILDDGLKMRSGIIRACDEDVVFHTAVDWLFDGADGDKFVENGTEQVETWSQLEFRLVRLDNGGDLCDVKVASCNVLRARDLGDVNVVLSAHLVLRNDELHRVRVVRVGDGVLEDADGTHHLACLAYLVLASDTVAEVARIADHNIGFDGLITAADADKLAGLLVDYDLIDGLVEHIGAAVDGRETRKRLGKLTKTVERVDVGRFSVACHGRGV